MKKESTNNEMNECKNIQSTEYIAAKDDKEIYKNPDPITEYDQVKIYEKKIRPLISKVINECVVNNIPIFCVTAPRNTKDDTTYRYDFVFPSILELNLTKDLFAKHIEVSRGFDVVIPGATKTLDNTNDYLEEHNEDLFEELDE